MKLLPPYFKIVGLIMAILAFTPIILVKACNFEMVPDQKKMLVIFTMNVFILGLFFMAMSRDKVEDEMIQSIRLRAMAFAFSFIVLYVIIMPIVNLFFDDISKEITGQQVVITMLLVFIMMYYVEKRRS